MYDIRQFKPTLYLLLVLGIGGFALAAHSPGILVLGVGGVLLNAWLVATGRFVPLPRWLANAVTLLAFVFIVHQVLFSTTREILVIGQFLVLLQLIKVFEQRANRDYAQLLVLSLLLMVAAAISTASLLFGLLLIAYLFISLYGCLLFHLKVETDNARAAFAVAPEKINPATLRQDQRFLSRSMRRLTALVSTVAVTTAVVVFLFFPRGTGAGFLGPVDLRPQQSLTGFSEQVSFQQVARITQSNEVVARVWLWKNDEPVRGTQTLLLRGVTHDVYGGRREGFDVAPWQWYRTPTRSNPPIPVQPNQPVALGPQGQADRWRQRIKLDPVGTTALFAMPGPTMFLSRRGTEITYVPRDETLRLSSAQPSRQTMEYEVVSRNFPGQYVAPPPPPEREEWWRYRHRDDGMEMEDDPHEMADDLHEMADAEGFDERDREWDSERERRYGPRWESGRRGMGYGGWPGSPRSRRPRTSMIDPQIETYARRADVAGDLAELRGTERQPHELDEEIARRIEQHLRTDFEYTLDLTDTRRLEDQDPLVAFLYDFRRGHCEYFAGAMVLMCQSLGVQARMVVGFKTNEYNNLAGYYIVRQSHAHAWVEVLTPQGWMTFDPTSGREAAGGMGQGGLWQGLTHFFNYLEYKWADHVVAYDQDSRGTVVDAMERRMTNTAISGTATMSGWRERWKAHFERFNRWWGSNIYFVSAQVLGGMILLMLLVLVAAVGVFAWEKWRLRKRAARIGLDSLSPSDQLRLARQLGFYDDLMRLLERHQIVRPRHLTPMEFSDSLVFLPTDVYDSVRRLTHLFYRIRFGRAEIKPEQRKRLEQVIARIEGTLATGQPNRNGG